MKNLDELFERVRRWDGAPLTMNRPEDERPTAEARTAFLVKDLTAALTEGVDELRQVTEELEAYRQAEREKGPEGEERVSRVRQSFERLTYLRKQNERLTLKSQGDDAVLAMTVDRLGGEVEGRPTIRLNFLQRIDQLVEVEKLYSTAVGRRGRAIAVIRRTQGRIEDIVRELTRDLADLESEP